MRKKYHHRGKFPRSVPHSSPKDPLHALTTTSNSTATVDSLPSLVQDGNTRPQDRFLLCDPRHVSAVQRKYNNSIWIVIWCLSLMFCPIMVGFPTRMLSSTDGTNFPTQFSVGDTMPPAFPWISLSFGLLVLLGETGTLYIDLTRY